MKPQRDLSHIHNLDDLKMEIQQLKASLTMQETEMKERIYKLPQDGMQMGLQPVVHFLNKKGVARNTLSLLSSGIGLWLSIRKQKKGIRRLVADMKEIIIVTLVSKIIRSFIARKKQKRNLL